MAAVNTGQAVSCGHQSQITYTSGQSNAAASQRTTPNKPETPPAAQPPPAPCCCPMAASHLAGSTWRSSTSPTSTAQKWVQHSLRRTLRAASAAALLSTCSSISQQVQHHFSESACLVPPACRALQSQETGAGTSAAVAACTSFNHALLQSVWALPSIPPRPLQRCKTTHAVKMQVCPAGKLAASSQAGGPRT